jgi:DNA-binding NarL/FixJ family response regulator
MNEMERDSANRPIRLVLVDDHPLIREGLRMVLEEVPDFEVVGEGANGADALRLVREHDPDVLMLDVNLPIKNGIEVTREIKSDRLPTRIIMVTAYDDQEQILHAMRAGASAYCSKDTPPKKLIDMIRYVHQGNFVVDNRVFDEQAIKEWLDNNVEAMGAHLAYPEDHFLPLSPREMEILHCVTRGMSNKEIAKVLGISHQTVKNHMTSILKKLAVNDRTQAAVYALRHGWVRLEDTVMDDDLFENGG